MPRLLFATDFHGNERAYREFFELAAEPDVELAVLGGDLLPHPHRGGDWIEEQRAFLLGPIADQLARLRRRSPGTDVYGLLGNDDFGDCARALDQLGDDGLIHPLHLRAHVINGGWIAGYSCVPVTPFQMSDWDRFDSAGWEPAYVPDQVLLSDEAGIRRGRVDELRARATIEDDLTGLAQQSDPARTIYVAHTPPYGTRLDVMAGGPNIGSRALRTFLEREQPPLSLHGHIHESPARGGSIVDRIGATVCVNPGGSLNGLRAVRIDSDDPQATLELV